jgi:putative transposase
LAYWSQEVEMKHSRFNESQIVGILKEADSGVMVKDICRKYGISDATYYKWKSKYGGLEVSDVRRMRELESENSKLKRMYADVSLENQALKDLISKKL